MTARWDDFPRYVPVGEQEQRNREILERMQRDGLDPQPVQARDRRIARSFWGRGWCEHLESFSDYENRLPRGRRYVQRGAVVHLEVAPGLVSAVVSGTTLYNVAVEIAPLSAYRWRKIRKACAGRIGSVLELLQGRLSDEVMAIVADRDQGLFPQPRDITLSCDCPDWAEMCKHVASALYGVGARLDDEPELLFRLRDVDPAQLIAGGLDLPQAAPEAEDALDDADLEGIFGIELAAEPEGPPPAARSSRGRRATGKTVAKERSKRGFRATARSIAHLREDFGLSVEAFADVIGVSAASVYRWESCAGRLKLQSRPAATLRRLAELRADLLAQHDGETNEG